MTAGVTCLYLVRGDELARVEGERAATVARLPATVNALAYALGQDLYYAIAGDGIATITPAGELTIRAADEGALYAVDTRGPGPGRLTRIDPGSGRVTFLPGPADLPGTGSYGAVFIQMGTLHAFHNDSGNLFHIPLTGPTGTTATVITGGTAASDAAPCPRPPPVAPRPAPAPVPPPEPRPPPAPSPAESPIPTVSSPPAPKPAAVATRSQAPRVPPKSRMFFIGAVIPALIVAARGAVRPRR